MAEVDAPAGLVMLAPSLGTIPETAGRDDRYDTSGARHDAAYMNARTRHFSGANFAFADGHAKWYKAPADYRARSTSGVVWQRCEAPSRFANAAGWFGPLGAPLPASNAACQ